MAALIPLGLAGFGWAVRARAHWALPLAGSVAIGAGMVAGYVGGHAYIVEVFGEVAGSALAGAAMLRGVVTGGLVVVGWELYRKLGYAW